MNEISIYTNYHIPNMSDLMTKDERECLYKKSSPKQYGEAKQSKRRYSKRHKNKRR